MLRKTQKQPQTVAEKVSKLLAHPNDSESDDNSDVDVNTAARVVDFEDEYDLPDSRSTDFRKRNVKLLSEQSERYKGKITSRKEFEQDEDDAEDDEEADEDAEEELPYEESDSDEEEQLESIKKESKTKKATQKNGFEDSEEEDSDVEEEEEDDEENEEESDDEEDDSEDAESDDDDAMDTSQIMKKQNQQAEIQKGLCVQNQLKVWERLLEMRINTQKLTSKVNLLPPPATLQTTENEELQAVMKEAQERSSRLLQQLIALQSALTQQNSEMRKSVKRKQPVEDQDSSTAPGSKRFASVLQSNFQNMHNYRNEVLLKWDDRTKLLTPGAGLKRKSIQDDYDIIKKIDSALANREALLEKSQTLKNNQQQAEEQENAEGAPAASGTGNRQQNVYDDSDFYHQQLRELIEYKASSTSSQSDIAKQFVELQKLRQKMKKKVDTRASKGRKLR